jgi:hypothetical protein
MLPTVIAIGPHRFAPRIPSLPVLLTYSRLLLSGEPQGSVTWTEVVLSALDACHPPGVARPWGLVKGDLPTIGRAVGAWCETAGVSPMDAYAPADELAAAILRAVSPPTQAAVEAAVGNSEAPAGTGSGGASSSPASGAETASAG